MILSDAKKTAVKILAALVREQLFSVPRRLAGPILHGSARGFGPKRTTVLQKHCRPFFILSSL